MPHRDKEKAREYQIANRDKRRLWENANRAKINEQRRARYALNGCAYAKTNAEKIKEYKHLWYVSRRDEQRARRHERYVADRAKLGKSVVWCGTRQHHKSLGVRVSALSLSEKKARRRDLSRAWKKANLDKCRQYRRKDYWGSLELAEKAKEVRAFEVELKGLLTELGI